MADVICQECGRKATYSRKMPKKARMGRRVVGRGSRSDHDLCERCWKSLQESRNRDMDYANGYDPLQPIDRDPRNIE